MRKSWHVVLCSNYRTALLVIRMQWWYGRRGVVRLPPIPIRLHCPLEAKRRKPLIKRILLVIDVQNEYFSGLLPITHPQGHLRQLIISGDLINPTSLPLRFGMPSMPWQRRPSETNDLAMASRVSTTITAGKSYG